MPFDFQAVDQEIRSAVERGVFPGCVLLVNYGGEVVHHKSYGFRSLEPARVPAGTETVYDLSSLTKPLATTLAIMTLVKEHKLKVDDRVTRFFHNFGVYGKTHVTFRHLLAHSSGLPAWRPFFREIVQSEKQGRVNFVGSQGAKEFAFSSIHREKPESLPGSRSIYSDLGFMLLGETVEKVSGLPLDEFCYRRLYRPLGLRSTSFVNLASLRTRRLEPVLEIIAPTERCPWRKRVLCGEVHDDNAYAMGGVAGHAGLFSCALDLDRLVTELRSCWEGRDGLLPASLVRMMWTRDTEVQGSSWALGWDTPSASGSSAGTLISRQAVGHLGFTGTSLWIDLERRCHILLLSNRVHPRRDNNLISAFRPMIHDLIMQALEG